ECAGKRENGGGRFRQTGAGLVALVGFDELQFLQIAGKGGLGDAQLLLGEAVTEFFLIGDTLAGNQAENLSVTKCFCRAHRECPMQDTVYLYSSRPGVSTKLPRLPVLSCAPRGAFWPRANGL